MNKKILLILSAVINLLCQISIFILHQNKSVGIEAIRELGLYILAPAVVITGVAFIKHTAVQPIIKFMGLLSLSIVIYIMSVHSGVREAVTLFEHPQYLLSMIGSIGIIVLNDIA